MHAEEQLGDVEALLALHFGGVDVCGGTAYLLARKGIDIAGADVHGVVLEVKDGLCDRENDGAVAAEARLESLGIDPLLRYGLRAEGDGLVRREDITVVGGACAHEGENHAVSLALVLVAHLHDEVVGIGVGDRHVEGVASVGVGGGGAEGVIDFLLQPDHSPHMRDVDTVAAGYGGV